MKFDRCQTVNLEKFYSDVSKEVFRVLKPGAFFITFSSPRLYHAIAWAVDKTGFEIRDMITWQHNQGQPKSFKLNHFIEKKKCTNEEKIRLLEQLDGWVTPQITPTFESICISQKPKEGTFLDNFQQYGVGLMRQSTGLRGTILESKPRKSEKGDYNDHTSVKPLKVIEQLIETFTQINGLILDPFMGSGTTAVAAQRLGRRWVGFEREPHYCDIARQRLNGKTVEQFFNNS